MKYQVKWTEYHVGEIEALSCEELEKELQDHSIENVTGTGGWQEGDSFVDIEITGITAIKKRRSKK